MGPAGGSARRRPRARSGGPGEHAAPRGRRSGSRGAEERPGAAGPGAKGVAAPSPRSCDRSGAAAVPGSPRRRWRRRRREEEELQLDGGAARCPVCRERAAPTPPSRAACPADRGHAALTGRSGARGQPRGAPSRGARRARQQDFPSASSPARSGAVDHGTRDQVEPQTSGGLDER